VIDDLEDFLQRWRRVAGVRRLGRRALDLQKIGQGKGDLGNGGLTRGFRLMRRIGWRGWRGGGALELRQFLAGVFVWRQGDLVTVSFDVLVKDWRKKGVREVR
jgi:hypothetical protein